MNSEFIRSYQNHTQIGIFKNWIHDKKRKETSKVMAQTHFSGSIVGHTDNNQAVATLLFFSALSMIFKQFQIF